MIKDANPAEAKQEFCMNDGKINKRIKYTVEFIEAEADELIKYCQNTAVPFFKEFCVKRGYPSKYVYDRFMKIEKFAFAHAMMKDIQESKLVMGALSNQINWKFTIFTLKNVAGWRDVKDLKHEGNITFAGMIKMLEENTNGHTDPGNRLIAGRN